MPTYRFLQPDSDQAIALSRLLSSASPPARLVAVAGGRGWRNGCYVEHELRRDGELPTQAGSQRYVPFGARSTQTLLEAGDVHLGDVVLTQSALLAYDKPRFLERAAALGIPTPETYPSLPSWPSERYPLFYKQRREQGGGARGLARSESDIPAAGREHLLYQEFINTPGTYGFAFLARGGEVLTFHTHFEEMSFPATGGSAVILRVHDDPRIEALSRTLIEGLQYSGWGLIEYKYCNRRKDFVLMELNAKFWASCELAFRNQPAFTELLFGTSVPAESLPGMFFVHRALAAGPSSFVRYARCAGALPRVSYTPPMTAFVHGAFRSPLQRLALAGLQRFRRLVR